MKTLFSNKMKIKNSFQVFTFLLNLANTLQAVDLGILEQQEEYCLAEGKLLSYLDFRCYEDNTQGPCSSGEMFVQKNISTGLGYCQEPCYTNGVRCGTTECENHGLEALINPQGETVCACSQGQVQDESGQCQVEFTQGTNCAPGQIILPKALAARYTDIGCEAGYNCEYKCNEDQTLFNDNLEKKFAQFNHKCSEKRKIKNCCMQPRVNSLHHYLNKMAVVHFQLGVCVNNPCTAAGTSLFVNKDGKPKCFKLRDQSVLKCTKPLSIDETRGELECGAESSNLSPFSINTRSSINCARGQVYNVYRKRCVRIFI